MVRISARFDKETYASAFEMHYKFDRSILYLRAIGCLLIALLLFEYFFNANNHLGILSIIILCILGIFLFLSPVFLKHMSLNRLKKTPSFGKEINWEINNDSLSGSGDGFSFKTNLDLFFKAAFTPKGILMYPQKNLFYWLPIDVFETDEKYKQAQELIKSKLAANKINYLPKSLAKSK